MYGWSGLVAAVQRVERVAFVNELPLVNGAALADERSIAAPS